MIASPVQSYAGHPCGVCPVVLALVLLLVSGGFAQAQPRESGAPARVVAEGVGGLLLGAAGYATGAGAMCLAAGQADPCPPFFPIFGFVSAVFTIPLGVYAGSEAAGAGGEWGAAFLGSGLGSLVGIPLGVALVVLGQGFEVVAMTTGAAMLMGSLLSFELLEPEEEPEGCSDP